MEELNIAAAAEAVAKSDNQSVGAKGAAKEDMLSTLHRIEANTKSQKIFAIIRTALIGVLAICAVAAVVLLNNAVNAAMYDVIPGVNEAIADVDEVVKTLNQIDIVGISEEINKLAVTGTESITTALDDLQVALDSVKASLGKLEAIDVDELNVAIQNLSDTVGPLASFFNVLG